MFLSRHIARCIKNTANSCDILSSRTFSTPAKAARVTNDFVGTLKSIVGDGNVSVADAVREQHGHDESHHPVNLPDVVVFAESVEHVSQVSKFCNDNVVPLIPFGTGTGLEGGVNALQGGVCLDVTKMDQILAVNAEDFDCTVEPGVWRLGLNSYLRDTGLFFPIDPGADASVCGMCATSASGTNAVRYGTMRENVLNLQVVLPDGRVIDTAGKGRRTKKTSAGYNLTNLFVGSEGTLGTITKATIRLYGIPEKTISAVCHFKTVQEAVDTVVNILQCGIPMAKLEFLDDVSIDAFNKYCSYDMTVAQTLFMEFHGPAIGLEDQFNTVKELVDMNNGFGFEAATDADERNRLWKARHEMVWACTALIPGSKPYSTDVCVPISNLPEVIMKTKEMIKEAGVIGPIVGHVGDGNFHVFFPVNHENKEEFKKKTVPAVCHTMPTKLLLVAAEFYVLNLVFMNFLRKCIKTYIVASKTPVLGHAGDGNFHTVLLMTDDQEQNQIYLSIASRVAELAMELDGTCTGEHGIGMGKRELLTKELGEHGVEAMKQVKRTFDPNGIMNPGKVFF